MTKRYPGIESISRTKIFRLVRRFQARGSIKDSRHENVGRPKSSTSDENIAEVRTAITETPQTSLRRLTNELETEDRSVSSVYRMLKFDLKLKPYKISIMQHLKPSDVSSRLEFSTWMTEQNESVFKNIWFSDEAHFHLNNCVNKQNVRFWGSEKPNFFIEKPLHSDKVTVWAALSVHGIIGPFFFENGAHETTTINADRYLELLKKKFIPSLKRKGIPVSKTWFQQDGATPHTAAIVIDWLNETFGSRYLSFRTAKPWPPHSPDLNPLDFYLWGHLKDRVYTPQPQTTEELKSAIRREMKRISQETCKNVIDNFRQRLTNVIRENGQHIEHLL